MEYQQFLKIDDKYYISTNSTYADDRTRVLNHTDTFGIFDRWGDIQPIGQEAQGLYHEGTRFLSGFELRINGERPLLLSSSIKEENDILSVDLTNPEFREGDRIIHKGNLYFGRKKFVEHGSCYETIALTNYDTAPHKLRISLSAYADFRDIFEVRGIQRKKRGEILMPVMHRRSMVLSYRGLDHIVRKTEIIFEQEPESIENNQAAFEVELQPQQTYTLAYTICFRVGDRVTQAISHQEAEDKILQNKQKRKTSIADVFTSNEQFNHWLERSRFDLISLIADTPHGKYPFAGVPWYNTAFGRDGILTAYEMLWAAPELAKGVLQYVSNTQAKALDPLRDAEPGKIFHETRGGEMVELNEVPFKLYYGTIDATPLFVMLAGAYYRRTADLNFIRRIWPSIEAALHWIDRYGDLDGDRFVEYKHKAENGLTNQGWKDSIDSVMYENGELAEPPIALCEVQAYVYAAKKEGSHLYQLLGENQKANILEEQAEELKKKFNEVFWDEDLQTYILALDGNKKPCRVRSSNAGHCLFTGIADEDKAAKLARSLMAEDMYSGWGIRTLSTKEVKYNPMSYHNGSVWPHDVALIGYGLARYGFSQKAVQVMSGIFDASLFEDLQRLPELFCGFERRPGEGPTAYPVACSPQAWSVAAAYILLQAILQIDINAEKKQITFKRPELPSYLKTIRLSDIQLDQYTIEIELLRYRHDVGISVKDRPEGWEVISIK